MRNTFHVKHHLKDKMGDKGVRSVYKGHFFTFIQKMSFTKNHLIKPYFVKVLKTPFHVKR